MSKKGTTRENEEEGKNNRNKIRKKEKDERI